MITGTVYSEYVFVVSRGDVLFVVVEIRPYRWLIQRLDDTRWPSASCAPHAGSYMYDQKAILWAGGDIDVYEYSTQLLYGANKKAQMRLPVGDYATLQGV